MNQVWKRHGFKIIVLLIAFAMALFLYLTSQGGNKLPVMKKAPDFQLMNTSGKEVQLHNTTGKVRIVYFFFASCPDVCPLTTNLLKQVQEQLKGDNLFGEKTVMYSISFDPLRDTQDRLAAYAGGYKADSTGWQFLRGDETATKSLATSYGTSVIKDNDANFIHSNRIYLIDKEGNMRQAYNANDEELNAENIVSDIRKLNKE